MKHLMQLQLLLALGFVILAQVDATGHVDTHSHSFCYDKPECGPKSSSWGGSCQTGKKQSPIDINVPKNQKFEPMELKLSSQYYNDKTTTLYAQNNKHTVQYVFTNKSEATSDMRMCGLGLSPCYFVAQFHFHWGSDVHNGTGSEHKVCHRAFPLELHIVHYKEKFKSLTEASRSSDADALHVIAVFFELAEYDNTRLNSVVTTLQKLKIPGPVVEFNNLPINMFSFLPKRTGFARYMGSLTTPGCDEKVVWTVFLPTVPISVRQMNEFLHIRLTGKSSSFNYRPVQPLNGRAVRFFQIGNVTVIN